VSKDHNNRFLKSSGIAEQFFSMGYNVIWLHYCSSDNYGGNHFNLIDGQQVPFKGKLIVDSIINEHKKDLENSTDLVVAGTSAGTYGIIFNIHLIINSISNCIFAFGYNFWARHTICWRCL
jgi:hypothetical protein